MHLRERDEEMTAVQV